MLIKASSFLERLEPLVVFIWTGLILCSMSALTTLSSRLFAFSESKKEKGFVPIVIFLTFFTAMLPNNEISALRFYEILLDYSVAVASEISSCSPFTVVAELTLSGLYFQYLHIIPYQGI